ncbi:acyl-CoA N-acyltransferase [Mycena crocata]|nr:acyl-CoA N-acyltransferase [Mycena crocata]
MGTIGLYLIGHTQHYSWIPTVGQCIGTLLFATGALLFIALYRIWPRAMIAMCEEALASDMSDIGVHYCMPAAFFVAVQPHTDNTEEVVGYVGLEYVPENDPQTAIVRRMIVSAEHRQRGIGTQLMLSLIAHAKGIPELQVIELTTGEYQPNAQKMYKKLGWEEQQIEWVWDGIFPAKIQHFRKLVSRA